MEDFASRFESLKMATETKAQFAERLGLTQAQVHNYLSRKSLPRPDTLKKIARASRKSAEWLLYGEEDPKLLGTRVKKKIKDKEISQLAAIWIKQAQGLNNYEKEVLIELVKQVVLNPEIRESTLNFFQYQQFRHGKRLSIQK